MSVDITTLGWGTALDTYGNAQAGVSYTISQGATTILSGTTSSKGQIVGNITKGTYTVVVGGVSQTVYVSEGAASDDRRVAEVQALDIASGLGDISMTSGTCIATACRVRTTGDYTKFQVVSGTNVGTSVTSIKLCVWDSAGTLLAASADQSAVIVGTSTTYSAISIGSTLSLVAGDVVYPGIAQTFSGTVCRFLGLVGSSKANALTCTGLGVQLVKSATGYAGGTPPSLTTTASSLTPFINLLP